MMELPIKDGVVVITGGTSGVGRAAARAFAEAGHPVAVLARGRDALDATEAELRERQPLCRSVQADVTNPAEVEAAAETIEHELGPVAVWVNSAMVTVLGEFQQVDPDDFSRVVDVVFGGTANGTRAALRYMRPRGNGRIIQVGSALAYRGISLQSAYCAAKHAVQGLSDSLRSELLHQKSAITISEVNLPAINTPQFDMCRNLLDRAPQPVPPIFQPEVAAAAIVHAAQTGERSLQGSFVSTKTIFTDRIFPGALDRAIKDSSYESQQTDRPVPAGDNLWEPLPGDHGCHGSFDDQAKAASRQEQLRYTPLGSGARVAGEVGRRFSARVLRRLA